MNKTLTVHEFLKLEQELSSLSQEKLPFVIKYKVAIFKEAVSKITKSYHDLSTELIKKLGSDNGHGNFGIPGLIKNEEGKQVVNPALKEYNDEMNPVGELEKSVEYDPFKLDEFMTLNTSTPYDIFFRFVEK